MGRPPPELIWLLPLLRQGRSNITLHKYENATFLWRSKQTRVPAMYLTPTFLWFFSVLLFRRISKLRSINQREGFESHPRLQLFFSPFCTVSHHFLSFCRFHDLHVMVFQQIPRRVIHLRDGDLKTDLRLNQVQLRLRKLCLRVQNKENLFRA